nr:BAHD acyltransferase [Echium plantagineum]
MDSSQLQFISTKFIKPSFSTPPPQKYKLGLIDQLMNNVYIPIAFYYPKNQINSSINIPSLLENSLSKVLASYYPLGGKEVDNLNIDCNEMGATLIEASLDCKMSQILSQPYVDAQDVIFPSGLNWRFKPNQSLIVAQLTHFACGGISISLCMSHKVSDAQTLSNFARDWAIVTKEIGDQKSSPSPQLNAALLLPPIDDPTIKPEFGMFPIQENCISKRFIFNSSTLSKLKAKISSETGITNPTRVEVVTALIHKCAYEAALKVDPNSNKIPIFVQVVNMRPVINPPLSSDFVGNLANYFGVPFPEDRDLNYTRLVSDLRGAKAAFFEKFKEITANEFREHILQSVEHIKVISAGESNLEQYICTSMCRFPFYDMDFGWGKPERASFAAAPFKNFIILMDDKNGDGVEAFVPLEDKIMKVFEKDPELLQYASSGAEF